MPRSIEKQAKSLFKRAERLKQKYKRRPQDSGEEIEELYDPAFSYDQTFGTIELREPKAISGGYYDKTVGTIELREPKGIGGGYYDNRE